MVKKKLLALGMAAALAFTAAGCGGTAGTAETGAQASTDTPAEADGAGANTGAETGDAAGTDDAAANSGEPLSVMIWDSYQEPGISQILADFTAETGIETELQIVKWDEYWTLLAAGAGGGSLPDVFWMHSNESERYMSNDMLLDLTEWIEASTLIDPANYPKDILGLYTYNDKKYAIPKDIDTIAVWYNKALFDEAGVEYPTADWTYDDFFEKAKALTKKDGSVYGLASSSSMNQDGFYNLIYAMGGEVISADKTTSGYDQPKTIEAMQFYERMIQEGVMPPQNVMSETSPEILFQSGKVAMVMQGSWMLAAFKENEYTAQNADVVELPKDAATGRRVSIYNGLGWAAAANTARPDDAWKLLEYMGSEAAQRKQAELGVTMSAYQGTSEAWVSSAPQFNLQAYLNMQEDMVIRPYSRNTVVWENNATVWLTRAWTQEITMEEACLGLAEEMNQFLAEE